MPSSQKTKGSNFEREIANFLSDMYDESFIKTPGSGSYVGGKNQSRTEILHEGQIKNFKGDIVPGESFTNFNAECKNYADFPFHLLMTGNCKVIDTWIQQLMEVAEPNDCNVLFMKFNRKGKFVAVESKHTWVADNFIHYRSDTHGEWIIMEHKHFFDLNKELFKIYSGLKDENTTTNN